MSTYNSKFSGAEIDALLEKVASGQVGGASVSEKEALAKEIGATHKHTITLSNSMEGMAMKARCVLYNSSAEALNCETMQSCLCIMGEEPLYINGSFALNFGGEVVTGDSLWAVMEVGTDNHKLCVSLIRHGIHQTLVSFVNFTEQTTSEETNVYFKTGPSEILGMLEAGFTFTDDVTEL